jgi:CheY-like chemotaxis protein
MQIGNASQWHLRRLVDDSSPRPSRPATESPIRAEDVDVAVDTSATDEVPKPLQVYVVEDSPIVRQLLASEIASAGANLSGSSADAQAAIGDVFALQPDLILIDIRLASGSGFDVLKALRDHSLVPAAIKVVLTNYADDEYRNRSFRLGADRFFDKSFETPQALTLIDTAAEARSGVVSRL